MNRDVIKTMLNYTDRDVKDKMPNLEGKEDLMEILLDICDDILRYEGEIVKYNRLIDKKGEAFVKADNDRHYAHEKVIDDMRMLNRLCGMAKLPAAAVHADNSASERRLTALEAFAFLHIMMEEMR